jgi:hypothetical protein
MGLENSDRLLLEITDNLLDVLEGISQNNPNAPVGVETSRLLDDIVSAIRLLEPDLSFVGKMKPIRPGSAVIDACLRASVLKVILAARQTAKTTGQKVNAPV